MVGKLPTKFFKAISCISTLKTCGLSLVILSVLEAILLSKEFQNVFVHLSRLALMDFAFDATVLLLTRAFGF